MTTTVQLLADWNNDDSFAAPTANEDISARVVSWSASAGNDGGSDKVAASRATFMLQNKDQFFSPANVSSPLYGIIPYGKPVRFKVTYSAVSYAIFRGKIRDYQIDNSSPFAVLTCGDETEELSGVTLRTSLLENKRVDEVITAYLDAAGWPAARRNLDVAKYIIPFAWAWDESAWIAIQTAAKQELGGRVYIDRTGNVRFESATYRANQSSFRTLSDAVEVSPSYRIEDLLSRAEYQFGRWSKAATPTVIFNLSGGTPPSIPAFSSLEIWGSFTGGAGASVTAPVVGVDIKGNSAIDGSGTDKSAQLSLSSFTAYGGGFKATIANADSATVYVIGSPSMSISGLLVSNSNDDRIIAVDATSPVVSNRLITDAFVWTNNVSSVKALAKYDLAVSNALSPRVTVTLPSRNATDTIDVLNRGISDLLQLDNTSGLYQSKISGPFFIEGWQLSQRGYGPIEATWNLLSRPKGRGAIFRVSPAKASGVVYAPISSPGSVPSDRIGW